MTCRPLVVLTALLLSASCPAARHPEVTPGRVIWQIGSHNADFREFAIPGRYAEYTRAFPNDVTYRIGRSTPARDWPFIGPGPSDPWAGQRKHPFRIDFDLASLPTTPCRLDVCLVDARYASAQVLQVEINGRRSYSFEVVPGTSDTSLTDASAGRQSVISVPFSRDLLMRGHNRITLTVSSGSWVLYDSVALVTARGIPTAPVPVEATAVYQTDGSAQGTIALTMANLGPEGSITVGYVGQSEQARSFSVLPGRNQLAVPASLQSGRPPVRLVISSGRTSTTVPVQVPREVWRIGRADGDFRDLAIAGSYPDYPSRFARDVTYRVGTDRPSDAWPFIHPGPSDSWAGTRRHPFRIRFTLPTAPTGPARLDLDLVDTQPLGGPLLDVTINGRGGYRLQMPAGATDLSLADAHRGKHQQFTVAIAANMLHAGPNTITLTIVNGSWLTYDSVALQTGVGLSDGPRIEGAAAWATPLFRRVNGKLRQMVRVLVRNTGVQGDVLVSLKGVAAAPRRISVAPGEGTIDLLVDPLVRPTPVVAVVQAGPRKTEARFTARPERRWRVFVGPSTHTDIGYTDWQERVYARHNENTRTALKACNTFPGFKWNLEVGYQADLLRSSDPGAYRQLVARIRQGQIGLGGLYLNMLTGLCSGEEMVRAATLTQETARQAGVVALAANLTDVPTAVGTLPMILSQAGVRYFADGVNDYVPFNGGGRAIDQSPYWWQGLDGSRVLAISARAYSQAGTLGMMDDVATVEQRLPDWLRRIGRDGYPGDAAYVYGAFSDNQPMSPRYAAVARAWNARWEYPKLIVGRVDEFFQYVEKQSGKRLPVFRGDFGVKWEDGAASSALETAMVRRARTRLEAAERRHALASVLGVGLPVGTTDQLHRAWQQVLLFDEHTWGAACSVTDPESEQTRHQWAVKAKFASEAVSMAEELVESSVKRSIPTPTATGAMGTTFAVFNEHSWPRDIVASCRLPSGCGSVTVTPVGSPGEAIPAQVEGTTAVFLARRVPPFGWRHFSVQGAANATTTSFAVCGFNTYSWATPDFLLRIDPSGGSISSLVDRRTGTEWVRPGSGYGLNQFLYALNSTATGQPPPPTPMTVHTHTRASVDVVANGPLRTILHVQRTGPRAPSTDTYLVLGPGRRIEFVNVVHKAGTLTKEAGYFAFPFPVSSPTTGRAFVELPYGVMEVEKDQAPGGFRDWFTTNSFAAVSDGRHTGLVASPHAPLFTVNDILRAGHTEHIGSINGTLFAYVFNNCWDTNYKASQAGDMLFSFSLDLRPGAFAPTTATRFGWEALSAMPNPVLDASGVPGMPQEDAWPSSGNTKGGASRLRVAGDGILVGGVTRRGHSLQVRLYNPTSRASLGSLELPGRVLVRAHQADLNGRPIAKLHMSADQRSAQVRVPSRSLATVLLAAGRR